MPRPKTTKIESPAKKPKKSKDVVEEFFEEEQETDELVDDLIEETSGKKVTFKNLKLEKCSEQEIKDYVGISIDALYRVRKLDVRILLVNGRKALIAPMGEYQKLDRLNVSLVNRVVVELLGKG